MTIFIIIILVVLLLSIVMILHKLVKILGSLRLRVFRLV